MPQDPAGKPVREPLPEAAASQLLKRASELDATRAAHSLDVAALREAASEAGISESSFDAALEEMRQGEATAVTKTRPQSPNRRRLWTSIAGALLVAFGAYAAVRRTAPEAPTSVVRVPMTEEAYLIRCVSVTDAIDVIRPHLTLPENSVVVGNGSHVVRVRGTLAQQQQVKATLDKYEREGSRSCVSDPKDGATSAPPSSSPSRP